MSTSWNAAPARSAVARSDGSIAWVGSWWGSGCVAGAVGSGVGSVAGPAPSEQAASIVATMAATPATRRGGRAAWRPISGHLARRRIDGLADPVDDVGGEAAASGVLHDRVLVLGDVDAVELVGGDVAVQPLDAGRHLVEDVVRRAGGGGQLVRRHGAEPGQI